MRRPRSFLTVALVGSTVMLLQTVAAVRTAEAADQPHRLSEIVLPDNALPEGCVPFEGGHAISLQAQSQYSEDFAGQVTGAKTVARRAQPMRCGRDEGAIFYYEYANQADAEMALSFLKTFIWGEDHPTSLHPELIDRWDNILVVTSFRHPKPIAERVRARVGGLAATGQTEAPRGAKADFEKGKAAYLAKDYSKAEKYLRALTKSIPDWDFPHLYLGHSLFYQEKFKESIPEYEKALALGSTSDKMEPRDDRILHDQLGMAYGLSGRLDDAKTLFEGAIKKDPEYPFYYYNLACTQAELGDLDGALGNLKLAYERKANFLPGESYPNPRQDDSFRKFLGNPRFEAAMKEIGF
ncbi:MAG TPA: tetratricopeptide repeat protein [Candidatus Polarisedimenticolia bacterium]|nr:tetratricopeptide repeat protein [Candidatus Polarisedimenticolia bacterium]